VLPGQRVHFHVSTAPRQVYRIFIYRLGPWRGNAGPAVKACVPSCKKVSHGRARPMPKPDSKTGELRAKWPVTDTFKVPRGWRSGYYVAKVVLQKGPEHDQGRLVPFIVRERPGKHSRVLVVAAVNTWQAYNKWGGTGLYPNPGQTVHAAKASFDRPYGAFRVGGQSVFDWELPLARFLESQHYDVSYTTDVDVDRSPSSVLGHKLVVVAGHSEYWTSRERGAFDSARNAGVNLFFAGANDGFWQTRYERGGRTMVGYKDQTVAPYGADPQAGTANDTTQFRELNRPECTLIGIESNGGLESGGGFAEGIAGGALTDPTYGSWFNGTGLTPSSALTDLVGYEWDQIIPGCTPPLAAGTRLTPLFHSSADGALPQDAVAYRAPSGAQVFSAGTFQFTWGLDGYGQNANPGRAAPDARLQKFAVNVLNALGAR
jgi:hypothetical protein